MLRPKKAELEADGISVLHLDADIYSSTIYVLETLAPYIRKGTTIMFDEYWNFVTWEHDEYKAWMEYLEANPKIKFRYLGYVPTSVQLAVVVTDA